MSKHFLLTSKKAARDFGIVYLVERILYIISPLVVTYIINAAIDNDFKQFLFLAIVYFIIFVLTQIIDYFMDYYENQCYADAYSNLIELINYKINHLDDRKSNLSLEWINQLIGQDFEKANKYFCVERIRLVYYVIQVIVIISIMFYASWKITLVVTVLLIICILLNSQFGKTISDKSELSLNSMSDLKEITDDKLSIHKEDVFQIKKQVSDNTLSKYLNLFQKRFKDKNITQSFYLNIISYGSLNFVILVVIILSCYYMIKGEVLVGTVYLFQSYTSQLWSPGEFIFQYRSKFSENIPIYNKVEELENIPEKEMLEKEEIHSIQLVNYQGVSKEQKHLHSPMNITFLPNHSYLIKGENGKGKTTLIENILQLTNRYDGEILYNESNTFIDGFTYIPSKPYISKFYNEEMQKASDGQKKVYQLTDRTENPSSVVIFDEPTNFLDSSNKSIFIDVVNKIKKDKIIIIISHDSFILEQGYELIEMK